MNKADPEWDAYWKARRTYRDVNFGALMAGTLPDYPSFAVWRGAPTADLIERLNNMGNGDDLPDLLTQAADKIKEQAGEIARLERKVRNATGFYPKRIELD